MDSTERFVRYWTEANAIVASYIHSVVQDHATADDLVQNVVITLMRRFDEYDESRPFVAWALGVAKMHILSLQRDASRSCVTYDPELLERITGTFVEMQPELETRTAALQNCLQKVQGRERQVLELRYFEDFKPREIALRLSMTSGAVRVLLMRLRTALKQCIERQIIDGTV